MADLLGQVTIPASGIVQLSKGLPVSTPADTFVQELMIQNNATHNIRVGDVSVSTTRGILLAPTGSGNFGAFMNYGTFISDWWIAGTSGDVIDFLFIK